MPVRMDGGLSFALVSLAAPCYAAGDWMGGFFPRMMATKLATL